MICRQAALNEPRNFPTFAKEANVGPPVVGEVLVKACKKMRAICKKSAGPFVYGITQSGAVTHRTLE